MTGQYVALYLQAALEAEMGSTDGELLARFSASRDELAFATLVQRHGPMVFGVCQRTAGHYQDAEDAFQATFLVLAQKVATIDRPALLGNWLYGVALRVSKKARSRRLLTRSESTMPEKPSENGEVADDLSAVIDHELTHIPSCYRDAILLCDVQGLSRSEAARRLGIPEGTISSRLAKGRTKLAARLTKRGVTLSALSTLLVVVPDALARKTVATALGWSAKLAIPQSILELTHIGGSVMKLTIPALVLLSIGALTGTVLAWPQAPKTDPTPATQKPQVAAKEAAEPAEKPGEKLVVKPRIMKRIVIDSEVGDFVWSSDGRFIAANTNKSFVVIDTKTSETTKPNSNLRVADDESKIVGFIPGTYQLITRRWERGQINGMNELIFWNINGKTPRTIEQQIGQDPWLKREKEVNFENEQGVYLQNLPDMKSFVSLQAESTNVPEGHQLSATFISSVSVQINSLQDGSNIKTIELGDLNLKSYAASPNGESLFVLSQPGKEYQADCWSLKSGKKLWGNVDFKQTTAGSNYWHGEKTSAFSPDGKKIAVILNIVTNGKNLQNMGNTTRHAELKLIDAATGKLSDVQIEAFPADQRVSIGGFSHDGNMIVLSTVVLVRGNNTNSVQIWDVTTGKLVKKWAGNATASFAPDRPLLVIKESTSFKDDGGKDQKRTTFGFWDLRKQAE